MFAKMRGCHYIKSGNHSVAHSGLQCLFNGPFKLCIFFLFLHSQNCKLSKYFFQRVTLFLF
jgi:hypothetical protein